MRKNPVHLCLHVDVQDLLPGEVRALVEIAEETVIWV